MIPRSYPSFPSLVNVVTKGEGRGWGGEVLVWVWFGPPQNVSPLTWSCTQLQFISRFHKVRVVFSYYSQSDTYGRYIILFLCPLPSLFPPVLCKNGELKCHTKIFQTLLYWRCFSSTVVCSLVPRSHFSCSATTFIYSRSNIIIVIVS